MHVGQKDISNSVPLDYRDTSTQIHLHVDAEKVQLSPSVKRSNPSQRQIQLPRLIKLSSVSRADVIEPTALTD